MSITHQYRLGSQISRVCNYLIDKSLLNGRPLSNISLQKLLYFAQGVHLANRDGLPLFNEDFVAWKFGPVVESVYHEFKIFGNNYIAPDFYQKNDFEKRYISFTDSLTQDHKACLDVTYKAFGHFSAYELVELTHVKDSPWSKAYQEDANNVIKKDDIKNFFLSTYLNKA